MDEKIYVKITDVPKTRTRKEFIRRFLNGNSYNSYSDEACTQLQCENGRWRSITELHKLTLSRFPVTSFEAIIRIIKELIDSDSGVTMIYCNQVNKVVLKYMDRATRNYMSNYSRDNYYNTEGVDGYSLADYERIINKL